MNTNYFMLQELLKVYHPKTRGMINNEEYTLVRKILCLDDMDTLALRNLRDFTVTSMGHSEKMEDWDRMSAITYCIDTCIIELGGEV